jgi:hypothetical protein
VNQLIVRKITEGFVEQIYDTEKGRFVSQRFVAGDVCDYISESEGNVPDYFKDKYLPFNMVQPIQENKPESNFVIVRKILDYTTDDKETLLHSIFEPVLIVTTNQVTDIKAMHKGAAEIVKCDEDELYSIGLKRINYADICQNS